MKSARIAYVSLVLSSSEGVFRKLHEQADACARQGLSLDIVWITSERNSMAKRPSRILATLVPHKSNLQFRIQQVREFNRLTSRYDAVFLRYPTMDPVMLGCCFPKSLAISEHHTKELDEMKLSGDWRYPFERFGAARFFRRFGGLSAVTNELLQYETSRLKVPKPSLLTPNCIDVDRYRSLVQGGSIWEGGRFKLVMTCAQFVPWHGLDLVLKGLKEIPSEDYELHLCGSLSPAQFEAIRAFPSIVCHGNITGDALVTIYGQCHVGLSCFALERKGMKEASSLKVREYLACGIPAAYSHHDCAFPVGFPYVLQQAQFNYFDIRQWIDSIRHTRREEVIRSSRPFISVDSFVLKQHGFASLLFQSNLSRQVQPRD